MTPDRLHVHLLGSFYVSVGFSLVLIIRYGLKGTKEKLFGFFFLFAQLHGNMPHVPSTHGALTGGHTVFGYISNREMNNEEKDFQS